VALLEPPLPGECPRQLHAPLWDSRSRSQVVGPALPHRQPPPRALRLPSRPG
jgi:hypothetical protein